MKIPWTVETTKEKCLIKAEREERGERNAVDSMLQWHDRNSPVELIENIWDKDLQIKYDCPFLF